MKLFFILAFLANMAIAIVSVAVLPEETAVHFGFDGAPDRWGNTLLNTGALVAVQAFLFLALFFTPWLLRTLPPGWINIPNRSYWLAPENIDRARAIVASYLWQFGAAIFALQAALGLLVFRANRTPSACLDPALTHASLAVFAVYFLVWLVVFLRAFSVPGK